MTVRFCTEVFELAATGLLAERTVLAHWCKQCRQQVQTDDLLTHARAHIAETQREGDAIE
jgi:transcriptional regulator GlxA family with amidase domain